MKTKVVFIMGPGHCGSTLLDLILGSHSDAFSLGELHILQKLFNEKKELNQICRVCDSDCSFWGRKAPIKTLKKYYSKKNTYRKAVTRMYRYIKTPYELLSDWSGKSILVDSSKQPSWFKVQLRSSFAWRNTTPYLIFLTRDGRGVVNSYYRKYPERGFENIIDTWKSQITEMNLFYNQFPNTKKIVLKYEYLAENPEQAVISICDFLGETYEPNMLKYWQHEHHPINGNLGTQSLLVKHNQKQNNKSQINIEQINTGNKHYEKKYYDDAGLAIKLDLRWQKELSKKQLEVFHGMVGDLNESFAY